MQWWASAASGPECRAELPLFARAVAESAEVPVDSARSYHWPRESQATTV
ncbi:hypothetical protein Acsp02_10950 [Actinoplanes sp. NBRC 103695]|nr:hypothetical protein Acsp02_10950 [Actinoplanes sp. NBRC 103695]